MDIMDEMENPVSLPAAEAADGTARADLEAAVAANNLTAAELAQRKEQYYMRELSELRAELDAMKQQQQQQQTTPDGFQSAFLLAFGRLGESPTSWHQATCFALSSDAPEDGWLRGKAGLLLAASALMMFVQSLSACAILVGTTIPSCESNDQCLMPGTFCRVGERNRCDYCGEDNPLELQYHPTLLDPLEAASPGEMDSPRSTWCGPDSVATEREWECGKPHPPGHKMNWAGEWYGYDETLYNTTHVIEVCRSPVNERRGSQDMKFSAVMTIAWCDACMHENTGSVDPLTATRLQQANYRAMSFLDHGTFFFASVIVGLTASGELKDILLCDLAASRAQTMSSGSNRLMSALSGCRRWVVLPAMVSAIPQLVLFRGGDALSIALNTIAVLFLCEIDNLAFMFGFLERLKVRGAPPADSTQRLLASTALLSLSSSLRVSAIACLPANLPDSLCFVSLGWRRPAEWS
eukprot:SAG31_NODE_2400_length_5775_cov_2.602185_2_plen_466_part_00